MHIITPTSAQHAQDLALELGANASFIAGGTIVQQAWDGPRLAPAGHRFINVMGWPHSQTIAPQGQHLRIGAQARLEAVRTHPLVQAHAPLLCTALRQLGALGIRRLGTLGGNIGWGMGDAGPVLLVMDALAELADGSLHPLQEVLQRPALPLMLAFHLPLANAQAPLHLAFEKVGYRAAFTPARIRVALRWRDAARGCTLTHAAAGAPGTPIHRLHAVEALMHASATQGQPPSLADVRRACQRSLPDHLALMASRLIAGHCGLLAPAAQPTAALSI